MAELFGSRLHRSSLVATWSSLVATWSSLVDEWEMLVELHSKGWGSFV